MRETSTRNIQGYAIIPTQKQLTFILDNDPSLDNLVVNRSIYVSLISKMLDGNFSQIVINGVKTVHEGDAILNLTEILV